MVFSLLLASALAEETTQQTAAEASENPFEDVKESDWCYDAVQHVQANSFSNGTTDTTFSPHAPCTEAQALTFLWRALGRPDIGTAAAPDAPYYEQAILWASEQGFVDAVGISTTAPAPVPTSSPIFTSVGRHFCIAFLCTLPAYKCPPKAEHSVTCFGGNRVSWAVISAHIAFARSRAAGEDPAAQRSSSGSMTRRVNMPSFGSKLHRPRCCSAMD